MSHATETADKLADDVFKAMEQMGDDRFYVEVAKEIGALSSTLEEAFVTSIRVRIAEDRARAFIARRLSGQEKDQND